MIEPKVGMWLRIKPECSCPLATSSLIRVEEITDRGWVLVTDWLDFDKPAFAPPTTECAPPWKRPFTYGEDDFEFSNNMMRSEHVLRCWDQVWPDEVEPLSSNS